jgi:hypothetical protein
MTEHCFAITLDRDLAVSDVRIDLAFLFLPPTRPIPPLVSGDRQRWTQLGISSSVVLCKRALSKIRTRSGIAGSVAPRRVTLRVTLVW